MSTEADFNPFRPDGELSKEAETLLKNSTIMRDKVIINDPTVKRPQNGVPHPNDEPQTDIVKQSTVPVAVNCSPARSGEVVSGQVPLANEDVSGGDQQQPLQVEQVKIKSGLKCCTVH